MTTLAQLRTVINNEGIVNTNYASWTTTFLNQVINDAILDYSKVFPRGPIQSTASATADDRTYSLPSNFIAFKRIEFPTGETPPRYLMRLDELDPLFEGGGDYYDVSDVLIFARSPVSGESYTVWYYATHTALASDSDVLTVPDRDLDLLIGYVKWQAYLRRLTDEEASPTADQPYLDTLRLNASSAKSAYDDQVRQRKRAGRGRLSRWADPTGQD